MLSSSSTNYFCVRFYFVEQSRDIDEDDVEGSNRTVGDDGKDDGDKEVDENGTFIKGGFGRGEYSTARSPGEGIISGGGSGILMIGGTNNVIFADRGAVNFAGKDGGCIESYDDASDGLRDPLFDELNDFTLFHEEFIDTSCPSLSSSSYLLTTNRGELVAARIAVKNGNPSINSFGVIIGAEGGADSR